MNILLDAYFDHNFGDDLFISILTNRYPHHRFFAFIAKCPESVQHWANAIPNLTILPHCAALKDSGFFDAYVMIGGDVIPDKGDYTGSYERRLSYMRCVKQAGGYVAMLGFSLYDHYSQQTYLDICEMLRLADDVAVRDQASYDYLRSISSDSKIRLCADMSFIKPLAGKQGPEEHILGINVRRKLSVSEDEYQGYLCTIAQAADCYLDRFADGEARFLCLSSGSAVDAETAADVIARMKNSSRTKVIPYEGQVNRYIEEFRKCDAFITTRFHAMAIALQMGKPFVPVPYEVKLTHVLDQIGYNSVQLPYGPGEIDEAALLKALSTVGYDRQAYEDYRRRAEALFDNLDKYLGNTERVPTKNAAVAFPVTCEADTLRTQLASVQGSLNKSEQTLRKEADTLRTQLVSVQNRLDESERARRELETKNTTLVNGVWSITQDALQSRVYRIAYLFHRWQRQGRRGTPEERRAFRAWVRQKLRHRDAESDSSYNPFRSIQKLLLDSSASQSMPSEEEALTVQQQNLLAKPYQKCDILMFGVIDYDFRHQRPQQFAQRFARNGHRVFYINANFHRPDSVTELEDNLYMVTLHYSKKTSVYETDFSEDSEQMHTLLDNLANTFCIRDALTIADYPNWIHAVMYLREQYGFKFAADYMDDFTGFLGTTSDMLAQNCKMLLRQSDMVVASSQFLHDIAIQYNQNCAIVRNGTEFEHFHTAIELRKPSQKKVIGYYGAIAHWFDYEKVCYLADRFPDCEVLIVGAVTDWEENLKAHPNIVLTGEKPYKELPSYLAQFDVCLIPFDTSTDLIKATNPVKFYEYLSAGKKVVATEIPELMPFRDRFVYMSNDNKTFGDYVEACLNGTDTLESPDACVEFGRQNDWQERYEAFSHAAFSIVPKVSVITITYNNLKYNQACLDSILNKTAYPNYEVILVDNLSTDGTRDWLREVQRRGDPRIKVILNDSNLGFAGGNNVGIHASDGDYVLLLNNDTLVTRGWMTAMVKHAENDRRIGMVGAVTNSIGNEAMIPVQYHSVEDMDAFAYRYTARQMNRQYTSAKMLAMFCTLISREVLNTCGDLDERYGIGMFEDDDYNRAVQQAGYSITIAEDAFVHHFQSLSFSKIEDENYKKLFAENRAKFEAKWNTPWEAQHLRPDVSPVENSASKIVL